MKNKRQDVDSESQKRNTEESSSPVRKESSRGRHRDKEDIKIVKERTPESEEENVEWETNRDDFGQIKYRSWQRAHRIRSAAYPSSFPVPRRYPHQ